MEGHTQGHLKRNREDVLFRIPKTSYFRTRYREISMTVAHLSEIETKKTFILKEKRYLGMYFDSKSWDGTDIFMMENTTRIIVTEPVMQELKKQKAKVEMTRLSEHLLLDKVE